MLRNLVRFVRDKRGTAAIEFGAIGGLLAMTTVPLVDVGRLAHLYMQTNYGVEAATLYAAKNGFDASAISAVVQSATSSNVVVANPSPYMFCGCPSAAGVKESFKTDSPSSCGTDPSDNNSTCDGGAKPNAYVNVQAQASFSPLFDALPYPRTIYAAAKVRVQ